MKIRTERERIKEVVERYRPYPGKENEMWKVGMTRRELIDKLKALDLNTATAEDIVAIVGHEGCVSFHCNECHAKSQEVVELQTGEGHLTMYLCRKCTEKAILMFKQHEESLEDAAYRKDYEQHQEAQKNKP